MPAAGSIVAAKGGDVHGRAPIGQIARGKSSIRRRLRERRLLISRATYSTK